LVPAGESCQKYVYIFSDGAKTEIQKRMAAQAPFGVWTPTDFLDLSSRDAIDQTLSRLTSAGDIRRITRGLYDLPRSNTLTGDPDPRSPMSRRGRL
jgi:hypothetical protein